MPYSTRGDVSIHYEDHGSGFPLLAIPGGGLNSVLTGWPTQVFNAMEVFKDDFRCVTMDQRNAPGGHSTGPVQVDDPWGAFADDQLSLMDHLGIDKFLFIGYCIGGPFAMKLMERAPERIVAAVLCQPVGHASKTPDYMYDSGLENWGPEICARRPEVTIETVEQYLHNLYRIQPDFLYSVSRTSPGPARRPCWSCPTTPRPTPTRRPWNWRLSRQKPRLRSIPGKKKRTCTPGLWSRCGNFSWRTNLQAPLAEPQALPSTDRPSTGAGQTQAGLLRPGPLHHWEDSSEYTWSGSL